MNTVTDLTIAEGIYREHIGFMGALWVDKRQVRVSFEGVPPPAPRQNKYTRYGTGSAAGRAQRYNDFRATLRDELYHAMLRAGITRFPMVRLSFKVEVWYKTEAEKEACDWNNVVKTVEDCLGHGGGPLETRVYPDGILIWDDNLIDCYHDTSQRLVGPCYRTVFEVREI